MAGRGYAPFCGRRARTNLHKSRRIVYIINANAAPRDSNAAPASALNTPTTGTRGVYAIHYRFFQRSQQHCLGNTDADPPDRHRYLSFCQTRISAVPQVRLYHAADSRQTVPPYEKPGRRAYADSGADDSACRNCRHRQHRRRRRRDCARRARSNLLDVDCGALWHVHKVRGNYSGRFLPPQKHQRRLRRRPDVLYQKRTWGEVAVDGGVVLRLWYDRGAGHRLHDPDQHNRDLDRLCRHIV